jgi:peptidoglycan/LPS O-acetylase OafA/YrhL
MLRPGIFQFAFEKYPSCLPFMRKSISFPGPLVIPPAASCTLDLMRALAAVVVMLSHLRPLFFVDYALVERKSPLIQAFYLLTGLGHEAVVIFFVLSGLLVGMSVLRMHARGGWSWSDYLLQRLSRLWVVLVPALLLTFFWDWNGIRLFGADSVYVGLPSDKFILGFNTLERLNFTTFLANIFFLQGTFGPTFGTNGPLWSLAYEFWYYLAFPCLIRCWAAPSRSSKVVHALLLLLMGIFLSHEILLYFPLWLMGVSVLFLPGLWANYRSASPLWAWGCSGFLFFSLLASAATNKELFNYITGLACAGLIYFVFRLPQSNPAIQADLNAATREAADRKDLAKSRPSFAKRVADFSYSLYVLHLPPLVFLHGWLWDRGLPKWQPTLAFMAQGLLIAVAVVFYAYSVSLLTEAHTDKVRRWIKSKWLAPSLQS